jgi:hypothetical protein
VIGSDQVLLVHSAYRSSPESSFENGQRYQSTWELPGDRQDRPCQGGSHGLARHFLWNFMRVYGDNRAPERTGQNFHGILKITSGIDLTVRYASALAMLAVAPASRVPHGIPVTSLYSKMFQRAPRLRDKSSVVRETSVVWRSYGKASDDVKTSFFASLLYVRCWQSTHELLRSISG